MKLIVHIGTHKTGSTALQQYFNENRTEWISEGLYYPPGQGKWPGHPVLAWWFRDGKRELIRHYLSSIVEEARQLACDRIFLSSEEFSPLPPQNLPLFREFGNLHVVAMLRAQDEYVESEYNQHVKMYETRFGRSVFEFFMFHDLQSRLNYHSLLQKWVQQAGPESVSAWSYNRLGDHSSIYDLFFETLSLSRREVPHHQKIVNPSIAAEATLYLARLNRLTWVTATQHQAALRFLEARFAGSHSRLLPPSYRQRLLSRFANQNQLVSNHFMHGREPLPKTPSVKSEKVIDFHDDFDLGLFSEMIDWVQSSVEEPDTVPRGPLSIRNSLSPAAV